MSAKISKKIIVAQLGARRHYAVPRALNCHGALHHLFTDICSAKGWPRLLSLMPRWARGSALEALMARMPDGINRQSITAFNMLGLEYKFALLNSKTVEQTYLAHLRFNKRFGAYVASMLPMGGNVIYAINDAGLEIGTKAREFGLYVVIDQKNAPHDYEASILAEERARFPEWEGASERALLPEAFIDRQRAEWKVADTIICGSNFVREAVAAVGGPAERCRVVPYGIVSCFAPIARDSHRGPLRVLTVGQVGLQKGLQYVVAAARALKGEAVFRLVGSISVSNGMAARIAGDVALVGSVPRAAILRHYFWADVFLFPSLCEGSAAVTYEALSTGLPVICTHNAGSVVRDGVDGFIVPMRDVDAIIEKLERLARDRDLLREMGDAAATRRAEFSLEAYGRGLLHAITANSLG